MADVAPPADVPARPATPARQLICNPVPIGVAGFALTTFTLGLYTCGQFNTKGTVLVFVFAAFYGGLTQFIAGFFAARRGDLFAAVFMTTYGAFWWSFIGLNLYVAPRAGSAASQAVTIFLVMWTVITFLFLLGSFFTNWVVVFTFAEFVATLIVLAISSTQASNLDLAHAGGYLTIILGALGWIIVGGEMINDMSHRQIVPFPPTPWNRPAPTPAA